MGDLALNLTSVLLSLQHSEEEKLQKTSSLLRFTDKFQISRLLPQLTEFMKQSDSNIAALCVKVFLQIFCRHADTVSSYLHADQVYDFFRSDMDDSLGGELYWRVLMWKALLPYYPFEESDKILKLLLRRSKHDDARRIPACSLRWWLILMWRELPEMRPRYDSFQDDARLPTIELLIHWLGSREPTKFKIPILQILRQEYEKMHNPDIDGTAMFISMFFDALPAASHDLQLVFQILHMNNVERIMPEITSRIPANKLVTNWLLLLSWTPVTLPRPLVRVDTKKPHLLFFQILLVVIRSYRHRHDPSLIDTCIRLVAAVASNDENAPFAILLLAQLKQEFPESSVWEFSFFDILNDLYLRFGSDTSLAPAFTVLGFPPHPGVEAFIDVLNPLSADVFGDVDAGEGPDAQDAEGGIEPGRDYDAYPHSLGTYGTFMSDAPQIPYYSPDPINASPIFGNIAPPSPGASSGKARLSLSMTAIANEVAQNNQSQMLQVEQLRQQMAEKENAYLFQIQQMQAALANASGQETLPVVTAQSPKNQSEFVPQLPVPLPDPVVPPDYQLVDPGPGHSVGIKNFGNTCYLNTVLQGLYHTTRFRNKVFSFNLVLKNNPSAMDEEDYAIGKKILRAFKHHMGKMMVATSGGYVGAGDLIATLPSAIYIPNEQQDVTETLRFLFDKFGNMEQPLIREVFTGEMKEHLQCQVCKTTRTKTETFSDLVLLVPADTSEKALQGNISIQSLLDARFDFELMTGDERLSCGSCDKRQDTGKWSEVTSPPQHLVMCLGRQSFDLATMSFKKETTYVDINEKITFGGFEYILYFVIYHQGKSTDSGHYLGIGRQSETPISQEKKWVHYDDSRVKENTLQDIKNLSSDKRKDDSPYIVFYRCTMAPLTEKVVLPKEYVEFLKERVAVD